MSPQQAKVIQMEAVRSPVIKKRENGTENLRHIKRRRKRNININVGNHQKAVIVTVIQEKRIQRRREVKDKLLIIKMRTTRNRQSDGAQLYCYMCTWMYM